MKVFITGITGSLGRALVKRLQKTDFVAKIVGYSRCEERQEKMAKEYPDVRYILGDVRDREALERAMNGMDIVIHTAALKKVPSGEYNPFEHVATNVGGAQNVISAAGKNKIRKVIAISTDKAVFAINLYGKTKAVADSLFVTANALYPQTLFSLVRYGNVMGSRGSVLSYWRTILESTGKETPLPVTDERMTRFWMTMDEAVDLVFYALKNMQGGEIFIPEMPSFQITDLAEAMGRWWETVGMRPGEKIHETIITEYDDCYDYNAHYVIYPNPMPRDIYRKGTKMEGDYNSDTNLWWLTRKEIKERLLII